jgi:putative transposase
VLPLRGTRLVRPWLTVIEDGFSRVVMGWVLSLYPTSAEVLCAIREAVVVDPDRGPWGGIPQLIRFDGGRDFLAAAVSRAAGELGCAALPTAPYSPHQRARSNGFIARSARASSPRCRTTPAAQSAPTDTSTARQTR